MIASSSATESIKPSEDQFSTERDCQTCLDTARRNDGGTKNLTTTRHDNNIDDFSPDDQEIQQDAANDRVACLVHLALIFFAALLVTATALCAVVVAKFGLIAFGFVGLLVLLFVSLIAFVNKVLRDDTKLTPVRRQLQRWQAVAAAVVLQEMRNFQLDWHEHLLLTDGNVSYQDEVEEKEEEDINAALQQTARGKQSGKSIIFRMAIKPFLSMRGRRTRRKQSHTEAKIARDVATYVAPTSGD